MHRRALLLLAGCLSATAYAQSFNIEYLIHAHGFDVGKNTLKIIEQHGTYHARSVMHIKVLFFHDTIVETSKGLLKKGVYTPLSYQLYQTHKINFLATFHWQEKHVSVNAQGKKASYPLVAGMQDNLSYRLGLANELTRKQMAITYLSANAKTHAPQIVKTTVHFMPGGKVKCIFGTVNTIKAVTLNPVNHQTTTTWYAHHQHQNVAVKTLVTDQDGDTVASVTLQTFQMGASLKSS